MKKKEKIKSKFWTLKYKNVIFYKTKVQTNQVQNKESTFYVLIVILLNLEIIYMWCQIFQHFFDRKENQKYLIIFQKHYFLSLPNFSGIHRSKGLSFRIMVSFEYTSSFGDGLRLHITFEHIFYRCISLESIWWSERIPLASCPGAFLCMHYIMSAFDFNAL